MTDCAMITERPIDGGGNVLSSSGITVRRRLAIGDVLCASVVADKLAQQGFEVTMQSHPATHCVLRRVRSISRITDVGGYADIDLDGVYETDPNRRQKHFHAMFINAANNQLLQTGISLGPPTNCRPQLRLTPQEKQVGRAKLNQYPRPWVFICPRSESYPHRQVPDATWIDIAAKTQGTKFWLGLHPAPPGIVDLAVRHVDNLIIWLSAADLLISVDTGPMHIGAALGIPIVAILQSSSPEQHLNDQNDYVAVANPNLDCLNCQKNLCPINAHVPPCQNVFPEHIAQWANARLAGQNSEMVSAVVAIYQPKVEVLNHCLNDLLPQVSEIIVTRAQDGILPQHHLQHPKIKYVVAPGVRLGYGKNLNYGARHANGKYLLLVNDDVFLTDPNTVASLVHEMKPGVGVVTHLLRYPSGKIYYAGVDRQPGARDWGHIDHEAWHPTFKEVTELENMCGTSILVRRETFYQIGGYDEDYFLYSEDNDFAMRVRLHGWKIMFTPHVCGQHLNHQSTQLMGDINPILRASNELFHRKWGNYLRANLHVRMGSFNYLRQ